MTSDPTVFVIGEDVDEPSDTWTIAPTLLLSFPAGPALEVNPSFKAIYPFAVEDPELFLGFNLFLGVVGSFTLIVGGVGVANIMYIVVRERTREIGLKRALGARRSDILSQIFMETTLIVAVGASFGLLIATLMVKVAAMLPIEEQVGTPQLSPLVVGITLALLGLVAFFSGLFPARRAANLDPVESLRYGA